jgi:DNA-binding GntR family transcriptional regulator
MGCTRDEGPCCWLGEFLGRGVTGEIGYRKLAAALREDIREERLAVGMRLPPQREFARLLGVGRETVASAYNVLQGEQLVRTSHGSGTWVVARPLARTSLPVVPRKVD